MMALEVIAIVSFGLSTLGFLAKIYSHLDHRFDSVDKHGHRLDKELVVLSNKVESMDEKYSWRISKLEDQMAERYAKPRQGGTGA